MTEKLMTKYVDGPFPNVSTFSSNSKYYVKKVKSNSGTYCARCESTKSKWQIILAYV